MSKQVSKSTLSKVLRHCGGVDSQTRHRILRSNSGETPGEWDVYCILPDLPGSFWKQAFQGLFDTPGESLRVKYNVYTKLGDTEAVMTYLEEAAQSRTRVVIIAALLEPPVRQALEEWQKEGLVILLSEQEELVNSFYVGSDGYSDGLNMGQLCGGKYPDQELLILDAPGGRNIPLRIQGFCRGLEQVDPAMLRRAVTVQVSQEELVFSKTAAAKLAVTLTELVEPGKDYVLYIPWGMPQLPMAVRKLEKRRGQIVCLCHDAGVGTMPGILSCDQDPYTQGRIAMENARRYIREQCCPEKKYLFVPSRFTFI